MADTTGIVNADFIARQLIKLETRHVVNTRRVKTLRRAIRQLNAAHAVTCRALDIAQDANRRLREENALLTATVRELRNGR